MLDNLAPVASEFAQAMAINARPKELFMLPRDWEPERMPKRAIVQIKWDGIRSGWRRGADRSYTREGTPMDCTSHVVPQLNRLDARMTQLFGEPHVFDGEYAHPDGFEATLSEFAAGKGVGVHLLFDAVPVSVYEGRTVSPPLHERLARLKRAMSTVPADQRTSIMATSSTLFVGEARDRIELVAGEMFALGHEGIVVKDADSPYVRTSSWHWQRIKSRMTLDAPIIGKQVRSDGKLKSILIRVAKDKACSVGVGFSEAQRADPDQFKTGRMVEVRHLGKTAAGSLRSPSFSRFRDDKEI